MEKFNSQSKKRKRPGDREIGKVTSLPVNKQSPEVQRVGQEDLEKLQDDELRKDLELLARMREQIEQLPEIDAARIVQLHDRIMRGEYQINGKRLAQKLDSFEADFQDPSSN